MVKMGYYIAKEYDKEPISIRIESEKLKKIDKIATSIEISRSRFINICIDYALQNISLNNAEE